MNYSFLPSKIREELKTLASESLSIAQARSRAAIDGTSGESYIVAFKDELFIFFRKTGDSAYKHIKGSFKDDISSMGIRKESIHNFFDVLVDDNKYSLKFSSFEEDTLKPIIELWNTANQTTSSINSSKEVVNKTKTQPESPQAVKQVKPTSLIEVLAILLMHLSLADNEVAPEEDMYIRKICCDNKQLLSSALKTYKANSFDKYLTILPPLNHEQKLCILANLMELGMCDGTLHRSEMDAIQKFRISVNISETEYTAIKQILVIKNNLSIL